jgi:hypothetical protein
MTRASKTRLSVERLEDRLVPTVTASLTAGSLLVTGSPTVPGDTIRVVGQNNLTQVYDGAVPVGSYAVSNDVNVQLADGDAGLVVDYTLGKTIRNLAVSLGNGNHNVLVQGGRASAVNVTGGSGADKVTLSGIQVSNPTVVDAGAGADAVAVSASVNLRDLQVLNAEAVDLAFATIQGNVTVSDPADPIAVSTAAKIGGSLLVRGAGGSLTLGGLVQGDVLYGNAPTPVTGANLTVTGQVSGNLYMAGTPFADTVTFAAGSDVGHDVTISLYAGDDTAVFAGQIGNGHTSITQVDLGDGNDSLTLTGTAQMVAGSTYLWLGAGDDVATVADQVTILSGRIDGGLGTDTYVGLANHAGLLFLNLEVFA